MPPFCSRRRFLVGSLSLVCGASTTGCGTILHPERRGQPAGPLDWKIVALNGIGLLFFFIPGIIAFAVDFSNGTIYLPCDECAADSDRSRLREVAVPKGEISRSKIEGIVSAHTGKSVRLEPHQYTTRELRSIKDFWDTREALGKA